MHVSTVKENSRAARPDPAATGHERLFQGRFMVAGGPHRGPCSWTAWNPKLGKQSQELLAKQAK